MTQFTKPLVLIVEDEALARMLAVDAFLQAGFGVLEAAHAAAALLAHGAASGPRALHRREHARGIDGIDLAEQLKGAFPALHVFITSALLILRPMDHLPATFVTKP